MCAENEIIKPFDWEAFAFEIIFYSGIKPIIGCNSIQSWAALDAKPWFVLRSTSVEICMHIENRASLTMIQQSGGWKWAREWEWNFNFPAKNQTNRIYRVHATSFMLWLLNVYYVLKLCMRYSGFHGEHEHDDTSRFETICVPRYYSAFSWALW